MTPLLPLELLQTLNRDVPCRESQVDQLATFFNPNFPWPSILVAYGLEGTSKLEVVTTVLQAREISFCVVRCRQCLSQRHLLSKIFAIVVTTAGRDSGGHYDKIDSINSFVTGLENALRDWDGRIVVVLDDIEKQRGMTATLLPALARVGELVQSISIIMISDSPRPLSLHKSGVPYIHFPPYSREEAIRIVSARADNPVPLGFTFFSTAVDRETLARLYAQFIPTVYDSLVAPTFPTSLATFQSTVEKLWPRFIHPYISGQPAPGVSGPRAGTDPGQSQSQPTWDFAKLMIANRHLFQSEGEHSLIDHLTPSFSTHVPNLNGDAGNRLLTDSRRPPLLKFFATLTLVAAHLASHSPAKFDTAIFSRLSSTSRSSKIRKRKLAQFKSATGSTTTTTTPSSKPKSSSSAVVLDPKTAISRPFGLDRLAAILRAVHPAGVPAKRSVSDRLVRELAELERLRLVTSSSGGGASSNRSETATAGWDDVEGRRWRINVGREVVDALARNWGIGFREFEINASDGAF